MNSGAITRRPRADPVAPKPGASATAGAAFGDSPTTMAVDGMAASIDGDPDRRPVVLVHGIPGSAAIWAGVAADLAVDHRVVAPDLLGFGASRRPADVEGGWADAQAETLARLLDAAGVRQATVVGHDFGGPVALALAARRPDLVGGLLLAATNAFPDTPIPLPIRAVTWPVVGGVAARALFSRASLRLMLRLGGGAGLDAAAYLGDDGQVESTRRLFAHALRRLSVLYAPLERALRELTVPVLVLWGERDPFFPVAQAERTAAAAPGARLVLYPGAGHFLPGERSREVAAEVRALAAARTPA